MLEGLTAFGDDKVKHMTAGIGEEENLKKLSDQSIGG